MDAPDRLWPPPVGAYAEERGLFRLLQVNGSTVRTVPTTQPGGGPVGPGRGAVQGPGEARPRGGGGEPGCLTVCGPGQARQDGTRRRRRRRQ